MTDRTVSVQRSISAPAELLFEIVADPSMHARIDGSGTVGGRLMGPERLELGARFGMRMRMFGVPYTVPNTVVTFEPGREIVWKHLLGHTWGYTFEASERATLVTETFAYDGTPLAWVLERMDVPAAHERSMGRTLARLETVAAERLAEIEGDVTG